MNIDDVTFVECQVVTLLGSPWIQGLCLEPLLGLLALYTQKCILIHDEWAPKHVDTVPAFWPVHREICMLLYKLSCYRNNGVIADKSKVPFSENPEL